MSAGDWFCQNCGQHGLHDCFGKRYQYFQPVQLPQTGWICPKCGAVHAPFVPACTYCAPPVRVSSGGTAA
jgi:hypothetical protein